MRLLLIGLLCCLAGISSTATAKSRRPAKVKTAQVLKQTLSAKSWNSQIRSRLRLRFHYLSDALRTRLSTAALRNVEATGAYLGNGSSPQATVFLVSALRSNGMALVLTNAHVTNPWEKGLIQFSRGSSSKPISAKVITTVASSAEADASLVLVKFPRLAWLTAGLKPVKVSSQPLLANEKVYSTGFPLLDPRLAKFEDIVSGYYGRSEASVIGGARQVEAISRSIREGRQTIQMGFENGESTGKRHAQSEKTWLSKVEGGKTEVEVYTFSIPNSKSSSGSPVFSAATNELVALHNGGSLLFDSRHATAIPIRRALQGLKEDYLRKSKHKDSSWSESIDGLVTNFLEQ